MMVLRGNLRTVFVVEKPDVLVVVVVVVDEVVFEAVLLLVDWVVDYSNELDSNATQLCDMLDMFVDAETTNASNSCEICDHMATF